LKNVLINVYNIVENNQNQEFVEDETENTYNNHNQYDEEAFNNNLNNTEYNYIVNHSSENQNNLNRDSSFSKFETGDLPSDDRVPKNPKHIASKQNYVRSHTPDNKVPGERLYKQYMEKLPKKEEHVRRIYQERAQNEMKEARFSPVLDDNSRRISKSPLRSNYRVEDRLIHYGKLKNEKFIKERTKKNLLEFDHAYHPEVSDKSQIMAMVKRKERMKELEKSVLKTEIRNKSFDITERSRKTTNDYIDSEEEYLSQNNGLKKIKNEDKNSKYTFSNLAMDKRSNRNVDLKTYEKYKTFTEGNNISIRTDNSRSKEKSPKNQYKSNIKNTESSKMNVSHISQSAKSQKSKNPNNKSTNSNNNANISITSKTEVKFNPEKNIHDYLYLESKVKKGIKEKEMKEHMKVNYPFKPTIPKSSQKLVNRNENKNQFINRLVNSKREAEELIVIQTKGSDKIDPKTGKEFFKPIISRGPKDPKYREVTVNLDGFYDQKILQDKKKIHEEEMLNNLEKKKLFLQNSMKSVMKMKVEKYKEIFEKLDSDCDGFISSRNIKLSNLDSDMLKNLTPLLEELQKKGEKMNLKEFCLIADKLLAVKLFPSQNNSLYK
jgi:hypothetical protein